MHKIVDLRGLLEEKEFAAHQRHELSCFDFCQIDNKIVSVSVLRAAKDNASDSVGTPLPEKNAALKETTSSDEDSDTLLSIVPNRINVSVYSLAQTLNRKPIQECSITLPWFDSRTLKSYDIQHLQIEGFFLYIFTKASFDIFVFDLNRLAFFSYCQSLTGSVCSANAPASRTSDGLLSDGSASDGLGAGTTRR